MNWRTPEMREKNARWMRRKRAMRRQRQLLTPDHYRACIDCKRVFLSRACMNLCGPCEAAVWREAERSTPLRTNANVVRPEQMVTLLYKKYGHAYKPSLKPRIPLSTVSVFEATGRKR